MSWYRTGTVTVTNGSKTVTGVGTLWTSAVNAGDAFALVDANLNPTGAWYEVESVTNNTTLVLKQNYAATGGSGKAYCIFNLVGNQTTPSFAARLATFFANFQTLLDQPTTTPTASSIPVADSSGDIADGWIPATVARLAGPTFTGAPKAPTAPKATNTTQLATTAHVKSVVADYAPLASPTLTGTPTAPTQTASDNSTKIATTAHVLRKLQSVGLGGTTAGEMILVIDTDWDTITTSGLYSIVSGPNLNAPIESGVGFTLLVSGYKSSSTLLTTQLAIRVGAEEMFVRRKTSASEWTPWRRVYEQGSILGTVSQSGGVPTGAVIERGSNANGDYVKFADGTMICWKKTLNIAHTALSSFSPIGSIGLYFGAYSWTLPVTFSSEPTAMCLGGNLSMGSCVGLKYGGSSGAIASIGIYTHSSTFTASNIGLLAIGRWF